MKFPLTADREAGMELAKYGKLEDGTFAGEINEWEGVIAFGRTLTECQAEVRSTLEDWLLVGFHLGHHLPVLAGIDLNRPAHANLGAVQAA